MNKKACRHSMWHRPSLLGGLKMRICLHLFCFVLVTMASTSVASAQHKPIPPAKPIPAANSIPKADDYSKCPDAHFRKCQQLEGDVYDAYIQAGADKKTAVAAGVEAARACNQKKCDAKNGKYTTDYGWGMVDPDTPDIPTSDAGPYVRCRVLGDQVMKVYIRAGANAYLAMEMGDLARDNCLSKIKKK